MREGAVRVPVRAASETPGGRRLSTVTGIVLAGGRSTRFGSDKLVVDRRGAPLLSHAIAPVAEVCGDVVVVLAPGSEPPSFPVTPPFRIAWDAREGEGPLAGLAAGLAVAPTDLALVAAGDMPELAPAVLREMLRVADETHADAVALRDGALVRPLPCVVRVVAARSDAQALLDSGERALRALLERLRVVAIDGSTWHRFDPSRGSLRDVDTPDDLLG